MTEVTGTGSLVAGSASIASDKLEKLAVIIERARIAVQYHRKGYGAQGLGWSANLMLQLMDQLGEALDDLDGHAAVKRETP